MGKKDRMGRHSSTSGDPPGNNGVMGRSLCLIMGPLDMKGLLGAATVMGTLMYGAGHVWAGHADFYLHDYES